MELQPVKQYHGLGTQRIVLQNMNDIPMMPGQGAPSFRKYFSPKMLPFIKTDGCLTCTALDIYVRTAGVACTSKLVYHTLSRQKVLW